MITVVGATGFTGRRVIAELRRQYPEDELVAVVRPQSRRDLFTNDRVVLRTADLAYAQELREAFRGSRLVVTLVSLGLGYAANLVTAIQAAEPDHAIFFSTTSIFSRVESEPRGTIIEAERVIMNSGVPATIFRPTMAYGRPGDRNIERLLRFLARSPIMPIVGSGSGLQQPVHVDDLAAAVGGALGKSVTIGRAYNLPGPRPMRFTDLVSQSARAIGRRPIFIHIPLQLTRTALQAWSVTGLWPRVRPQQVLRLAESKQADPARAAHDFGYAPREFDVGVREEAFLLSLTPSADWSGHEATHSVPKLSD